MARMDRTERLLNLVIALMASQQPMSRAAIRERIPGYDGNDVSFERKFERDKDELRSMGIPVQTIVDSGGDVRGYLIPREDYELPELDLTVAERTAIGIAAQAWSEAVAGPVAGRALLKLNGAGLLDQDRTSVPVQLTAKEAALLPLMSAVRSARDVTFDYQRPVDAVATPRDVSPWGLRAAHGAWYLVGFDHERQASRTFRLSRIRGAVTLKEGRRRTDPPEGFSLDETTLAGEEITARVRVASRTGAALRRRAMSHPAQHAPSPDGSETLSIQSPDVSSLTADICAAGSSAQVLEPPDLVEQVCVALDRLIAVHQEES